MCNGETPVVGGEIVFVGHIPAEGGERRQKVKNSRKCKGDIGNPRKSITPLAEESVAINDVREGCMLTLFAVSVKQVNKFTKFAGVSTEENTHK